MTLPGLALTHIHPHAKVGTTMEKKKSITLFEAAKKLLPGGVNSPVRAFKAVGGAPLFVARAKGSRIYDVDGNEFIDYVLSWGPLILGHVHPQVATAIKKAADRGTSYGAPTEQEIELAWLIRQAVPSMEMIRMVSSGTEAAMAAIRLARGYTGRSTIVKCAGCYHGHADSLLVKAGSGATTFGVPDSAGVPADVTKHTRIVPFNNLMAVRKVMEEEGEAVACVIVEPIPGNMGVVLPEKGYLEGLRALTRKHGALLIFDEVMTGFRVAYGGAQALYRVTPDLTCLGKIIGGGLPVGAYGGRKEIMEKVAPLGPVYQAGTLSGNPLAMAAGIATVKALSKKGVYERLNKQARVLAAGLEEAAAQAGVPVSLTRAGSQMCLFFAKERVRDYASALRADTAAYARFFHALLEEGVYFPPSQFEAFFLSTAHTSRDIQRTINAAHSAFKKV